MCLHRPFTYDLLGVRSDALCGYLTVSVGVLPPSRNLVERESRPELFQSTMTHLSVEINLPCSKDITILFLGSMILAQSMEHVRLHRRLALFVLSLVGSSIRWFVLFSLCLKPQFPCCRSMAGLMGVTAFLSMWINNSAATSIMIPAAIAIIDELRLHRDEAHRVAAFPNDRTRRKSKDMILSNVPTSQNRPVIFSPNSMSSSISIVPVDYGSLKTGNIHSFQSMIAATFSVGFSHCCVLQCYCRWHGHTRWLRTKHFR